MERARERVRRHERRVGEQHREGVRVPSERLLLHLTDRARERGLLLADRVRVPSERDLEHRLVGGHDPGLPSRDLLRDVHDVLEHRER